MWWNGGVGWAGWLMMALTMLALSGLLVVAVAALWRAGDRGDRGADRSAPAPTPERLLDERFARGEVDEEEYLRRRDVLRSAR